MMEKDIDLERLAYLICCSISSTTNPELAAMRRALQTWESEIRHNERIAIVDSSRKHYEQVLTGLNSMTDKQLRIWLLNWTSSQGVHRALWESDAMMGGCE